MSSEDLVFVDGAENTTEEVAETNDFVYVMFFIGHVVVKMLKPRLMKKRKKAKVLRL